MSRGKILVTGSNGQLGSELKELSVKFSEYDFFFFDRNALPLGDAEIAEQKFLEIHPDFVINCAAYTAVDKAESDKKESVLVNATGVGILASLCKKFGSRLIHFSTDYVFNGKALAPIREDAPTDPVNFYGQTKLMGEQEAQQNYPESIIVRTSWVYSSYGKNFVKTMLRLMQERDNINVVNDQVGSPTYAADLAEVVMQIITGEKWTAGIYNYSNEGVISWFEFANAIKEKIETKCVVSPIPSIEFPTPAKRPAYSVLDTEKIKHVFGIKIPHWNESLDKCLKGIAGQSIR